MANRAASLVDVAAGLLARGSTLESVTGDGTPIDDDRLVDALETAIGAAAGSVPEAADESLRRVAAQRIVTDARAAIEGVAGGASANNLTDRQRASLEAIVHVVGRPAVPYAKCRILLPPVDLGENERWTVIIGDARDDINRVSASIGRLELAAVTGPDRFLGTGWRAGADLLVTNRHVVSRLVADPSADVQTWALDAATQVAVNFCATPGATSAPIGMPAELVLCAAEPEIDLAILRVGGAAGSVPGLPIEWSPAAIASPAPGRRREVYVVGHPYRDVESIASSLVFGRSDGDKRWSPGVVTRIEDASVRFEHDCSTLGGSSGSCVFDVQTHRVIGLHVGGRAVNAVTSRGDANVAVAFARLGSHRAAALLRN